MTGHTCLALPVPALEGWVRERTAHYDESFVSADPAFSHAHLTLLSPWVPAPSPADLQRVGEVLAEVGASTVVLTSVEVFPAYPPYGGRYGEPTPHVTLDRVGPQVGLGSVRAALGDLLPAELVVDRVDLQWWGNDACRRLHSWPLGGSA